MRGDMTNREITAILPVERAGGKDQLFSAFPGEFGPPAEFVLPGLRRASS
jgi:hypothetical protein